MAQEFIVYLNNKIIGKASTIKELYRILRRAPVEVFIQHTYKNNDFANWADYLGETGIAERLRSVKTSDGYELKKIILGILKPKPETNKRNNVIAYVMIGVALLTAGTILYSVFKNNNKSLKDKLRELIMD